MGGQNEGKGVVGLNLRVWSMGVANYAYMHIDRVGSKTQPREG